MRRSPLARILVAAALVVTGACGNGAHEQNPVVARIGDREIRHSEIRCDRRFADDPEHCRGAEQYDLERILIPELVVQAAELHGISWTDAEVAATMNPEILKPENLEKGDTVTKAIARSFLLVESGANSDEVFNRELAPLRVPRPAFDQFLQRTDKAKAEQILRTDHIAEGRQQLIAQRRQEMAARALYDLAAKQAEEERIPPAAARRALWLDAVEKTNLEIVDPKYRMPNLERLHE